MRVYIKKNFLPIAIEILFVASCFVVPQEHYIYTNFLFYLALLIYFIAAKEVSIKGWIDELRKGKEFWRPVLITTLGFMAAFAVTVILESAFPHLDTGMIQLKTDSWDKAFIFAVSTILLPPVVEELFYRKDLIILGDRKSTAITMAFSMFLYAAEHSLTLWGIALSMIWALPLSVSYVKTRNIFVPMTAHFITNLMMNGADLISIVMALCSGR